MTKRFGGPLVAALIGFAVPAVAQEGHHGFGGFEMGMHELVKHANLTPAQHAQLRQMHEANREQNKALWSQMKALREQIADKLMSSGSVSESEIAGLQQQLQQLRVQRDQQMLKTMMQVRALLTPDQLTHVASVHTQLKSLRSQIQALSPAVDEDKVGVGFGGEPAFH